MARHPAGKARMDRPRRSRRSPSSSRWTAKNRRPKRKQKAGPKHPVSHIKGWTCACGQGPVDHGRGSLLPHRGHRLRDGGPPMSGIVQHEHQWVPWNEHRLYRLHDDGMHRSPVVGWSVDCGLPRLDRVERRHCRTAGADNVRSLTFRPGIGTCPVTGPAPCVSGCRRACAERSRRFLDGARHRASAAADGRAFCRRRQGRASPQGRAGAGRALSHRAGERRPTRRRADSRRRWSGGRSELSWLQRRWSRALEGEGQFVQIVGELGIGPSRV